MDVYQNIVARYRYDAYGKLLGRWGTLADANHYRFSSMEFFSNPGIYGYPRRFYEPNYQRWLNRDPIGEVGGVNLYQTVGNTPINKVDPYGLLDANDPDVSLTYSLSPAQKLAYAQDEGNQAVSVTAGTATTAAIAFFAPEALPAWGSYLWAAVAGAAGGYVANGVGNELDGQPFNQNGGTAAAIGGALGVAGKGLSSALKPKCPSRMGLGIVHNDQVVAHAPIDALTSHEALAAKSGTLLMPPQAGTPGTLLPGAQAFTYSVNQSGNIFITGSYNFNQTVNVNTVQVVTRYINGN